MPRCLTSLAASGLAGRLPDTYAGWKGSLPEEEVTARVAQDLRRALLVEDLELGDREAGRREQVDDGPG